MSLDIAKTSGWTGISRIIPPASLSSLDRRLAKHKSMGITFVEDVAAPRRVRCMEVRGGNAAAQESFCRPGIDLWVWSRPQGNSHIDGGDVHFLSSCASGRLTRVLIADICASGTAFSALAGDLRELMKHNLNNIRQGKFVSDMNRKLQGFAGEGAYATALIATFFAPTKSFALCNTGHPPPFFYRADRQEWTVLKQALAEPADMDRGPQGLVDAGEYQNFRMTLQRGDMVLCYSNAWTECRDSAGHYLGVDGLLRRVREFAADQPSQIVPSLANTIIAGHSQNLAAQDATLLLCRATDTRVSWKDFLLAPFRLFGNVSDSTKIS